jgi:hypothetical protein
MLGLAIAQRGRFLRHHSTQGRHRPLSRGRTSGRRNSACNRIEPSHARLSNHWSCLPFSGWNLEAAALTTNLTKALFFEKNARKTQNKTRRGRLLRAARRYLLAAAKELESLPRPPASRKKKDHPSGAGLPTQKPTARLGVSSVAPPNARACVICL